MSITLNQSVVLPRSPRPICIVGAGGIVRDGHLPAYKIAGFPVHSIYDLNPAVARATAQSFNIPLVHESLNDLVRSAPPNAVYDVAIPASALPNVLPELPQGAAVLIQKPLGENIAAAKAIAAICQSRHFTAAVNFQLRYAPYILAARGMIAQGLIGDVHDMEIRVTVQTPWHLWSFFVGIPRVEILYHSIHYVDLIRSFFGDPLDVQAKTVKHPNAVNLASTRSNIILNYGDTIRANITTNHAHAFGPTHQESYIKWEGAGGAIKARLGLLMDYPTGQPDQFEYCIPTPGIPPIWQTVPLQGSWFPHGFIGTMASVMRAANGETTELPTSVADAYRTMAVVEAAYEASQTGGVRPRYSMEGMQ